MMTNSYPKTFFLHLLAIIMLYVSMVTSLILLFQYINVLFPDPLSFWYRGMLDTIRGSISTLVVVFPVFIASQWLLHKEMANHKETAEYRIRKWLLYLTIFLAGLVIIIDMVTLVNNFLGGELNTRFILKVIAVLGITGLVFAYELWEVKRTNFGPSSVVKSLGWGTSMFMILIIVISFVIVGTPGQQRKVRLDEKRIVNLQSIQLEIVSYWQQKDVLPKNLDDITDPLRGFTPPVDPETGESYGFKVIDDLSFELCATFGAITPKPIKNIPSGTKDYYGNISDDSWNHEEGEQCFERTIDPELYNSENGLMMPKRIVR